MLGGEFYREATTSDPRIFHSSPQAPSPLSSPPIPTSPGSLLSFSSLGLQCSRSLLERKAVKDNLTWPLFRSGRTQCFRRSSSPSSARVNNPSDTSCIFHKSQRRWEKEEEEEKEKEEEEEEEYDSARPPAVIAE
jgi:hypothetical protein